MWGLKSPHPNYVLRAFLSLAVQGAGAFHEAHGAEPRPVDADFLFGDPFLDEPGRDRGKQNAAAEMARSDEQAVEVRRADDRQMIERVRPQTGPGLLDAGAGEAGNHAHDFPKN